MAIRVDENVSYVEERGKRKALCAHCSHVLSEDSQNYIDNLASYEGPVSMAGPQVFPDASVYVDAKVVFRQYCCPNCFTAFFTEVVPASDDVRRL